MNERNPSRETVLPLVAEQLALETRREDAGAVRVRIESATRTEVLHGEERVEQALVQRVPRDIEVTAAKSPWNEGDTLVVPVYAERFEVRRLLVLTEEIRIARRSLERPVTHEAEARRERAVVERRQPDGSWRELAVDEAGMAGPSNPSNERKQP